MRVVSFTQSSNIAQVGRLIGQKWRELSEEEKQPYFEEYEAEKACYTEQMKIYRSSPAYKRWQEQKQQGFLPYKHNCGKLLTLSLSLSLSPPPAVIAPTRLTIESRLQMMQQQQQDNEEGEYSESVLWRN